MARRKLRLATRGSALALWQAEHVRSLLQSVDPDAEFELVKVVSAGDAVQDRPLAALGGVGAFTREIQLAVVEGRADLAVHSLKDLPTEATAGLTLAAVPQRGPPFDALVSSRCESLEAMPLNATVATSSPRRLAQVLRRRPDLNVAEVRGNVDTRLRKLDEGRFDGLLLAEAGLHRLGLADRIAQRLAPPVMLPAPGQGALGVECRLDDARLISLLRAIEDRPTRQAVDAERSLLATLRAGCQVPVGAFATVDGGQLRMQAIVLSPNGRLAVQETDAGAASDAFAVGRRLAERLLDQGAAELLAAAR